MFETRLPRFLKRLGLEYIAVETGRGVVFNGADKDPIELHDHAYTLETRPGSSIGPGALQKAQGHSVVLQSENWKTMALTIYSVVLPNISIHPKALGDS